MGETFNFPDVGEGIVEGKLIKWHVDSGSLIKEGETLAEVETDKAVVEIPAPFSGVIDKVFYSEGDTMDVGKPMLEFSAGKDAKSPEKLSPEKKESLRIDESVPENQLLETDNKPITKQKSDPVKTVPEQNAVLEHSLAEHPPLHNQEILALPSVRAIAKEKGIALASLTGSGKDGRITFTDLEKSTQLSSHTVQKISQEKKASPAFTDILATPNVRKQAREMGIDISLVHGSGDSGRISLDDLNAFKKNISEKSILEKNVSENSVLPLLHHGDEAHAKPVHDSSDEVIPLTPIRKAIAKKMMESLLHAPQVTHTDEADVTDLVAIRKKEKDALKKEGLHLTFLPFFMKACAVALKKHPLLNASLDEETQSIILKKQLNFGIAVDTKEGLLLPVIHNVETKSIADIAGELADLAGKARDRKLTPGEMKGGTFSISSVGRFGGQVFTPILNYPESGLLGIGRILDKPIALNGEVVIRKMVTLSVSYDHRILDGGEAARFLSTLIDLLQDPDLLMTEMG